ncbi:hypothetical protein UF64_06700 [Thalassospira sp. HJ]|nr:hypothetical protein UF64_06700 [Thalassospira sp. HJ]
MVGIIWALVAIGQAARHELGLGSGPVNLIGMADLMFTKSKEKPVGRVGIPTKGFDAGVCKHKLCPSDHSDLHELRCRKTLQDAYLPAALLRVSAQI